MSEEPGNPKDSTGEVQKDEVKERMAELDKMKADLGAELDKAKANNEGLANLNATLQTLTKPQPAPQPEPEPLPSDEEFEADRAGSAARVSQRVMNEGLKSYHEAIAPELQELKQGLRRVEMDRIKTEDPKNFKRLEKDMNDVLDKYNYSSGLAERVFYQIRGRKFNELREMDRTESMQEPVPDTNSSIGSKRGGKKEEYDSLDETVMVHGVQKNPAHTARALGVKQEDYFKLKYGREMKREGAENAS